ncbi:SMP-30/gluconolactonase/LRE family protein [Noviherbaspirillum saxi]|uniref:SMP-30/gluconolactonase/LRE family protein n=1 Tax=Noviherbaspirillum saxi TaxID=2320863 RepID=A0A3A3FIH4_9BURK|nr:SMP-30/gluconolactonase/LRE family protein [Noviherbaspirillum saxi]RJF92188.1 SMP-30/gluconolactonase/LRE family protein [Noviherbaspirillum saxi]
MPTPSINLVADLKNSVGESPIWDPRDQALYWTDIPAKKIYRWSPSTGALRAWQAPEMVACIALNAAGGLIAGLESGVFTLQLGEGENLDARLLAGVAHADQPMRFNDGRCDRQGRFWAGTMHLDMSLNREVGTVYRFDAQGLQAQIGPMIVPNGMAWSPDGRTMYLSDSHPTVQTIWAFDYDIADGVPSNRRVFIDMKEYPGRPDGAAVDEDGCYWICGNDAGMVHRFTPEGRLDRSIELPVKKPAMCSFGGNGLETMYVTSIRPDHPSVATEQPLAGGIFSFNPGVKGLPEQPFPFLA